MNKFQGWKNVFAFTYKQNVGTKSYKIVTGLVAVLVLALAMLITIVSSAPDKEETRAEFSSIQKVLVVDCAEVGELAYSELIAATQNDAYYEKVEWETADQTTTEEEIARLAEEKGEGVIGLLYTMTEEGLSVRAIIPETSTVELSEGEELATVSSNGLLKVLGNGSVTVRAYALDGSNVYGEIKLKVSTSVENLEVEKSEIYLSSVIVDNEVVIKGLPANGSRAQLYLFDLKGRSVLF